MRNITEEILILYMDLLFVLESFCFAIPHVQN